MRYLTSSKAAQTATPACVFCDSNTSFAYHLNGYDLHQCKLCRSIGVTSPTPTPDTLRAYYNGFRFQASADKYSRIRTQHIYRWMLSLVGGSGNKSMLDVGGGGGFFARAFEDFNLGESSYIDLDPAACEFARSEMGLRRVICDAVENIQQHTEHQTYDLIYCRHVIEHLVNPVPLILTCSNLLTKNGVFVLQCPNGRSKEGILFPNYWRRFLSPLQSSNGWSKLEALSFSLSTRYGWGVDPLRHLWAITPQALRELFKRSTIFDIQTRTASLVDSVYSPYWQPTSRLDYLSSAASRLTTGNFIQGMHLIGIITRRRDHKPTYPL